jgi:hypothetical protein
VTTMATKDDYADDSFEEGKGEEDYVDSEDEFGGEEGGSGGEGKRGETLDSAGSDGGSGETAQKKKTKIKRKKKRGKKKKKKKKKKKAVAREVDDYDDEYYDEEEERMYGSRGGDYPEFMDDESMFAEEDDAQVDRYVATRRESARIMSKRFMERNEVKARILRDRQKTKRRLLRSKQKKEAQWRRKMERSPFMVDLIAENERIDEENKVRIEEETRRERTLRMRKEKIKNEIVLKALSEVSDLDALRKEKRLIADEEKRLKALLIMEKAAAHTKADLMAAQRAERQRKQVQAQYRRARLREETQRRRELETELLREKLNVKDEPAFSYPYHTFSGLENGVPGSLGV